MLVTFKTSAYSDITLFGTAAVSLLKLMGQSGNVPGAILAPDVPAALQSLNEGLSQLEENEKAGNVSAELAEAAVPGNNDDNDEAPVALHTRAGPLVSLLEAAIAANENVLWDK